MAADREEVGDLVALPLRNGAATEQALRPLADRLLPGVAWLEPARGGRAVVLVTWVSPTGHFLTKSSEVPHLEKLRLRGLPGEPRRVELCARDEKLDLVLAKIQLAAGESPLALTTAPWQPAADATLGAWLVAPTLPRPEGKNPPLPELRLGVVSAKERAISSQGGAIGITFDPDSQDTVRINTIIPDSPAKRAGLRRGDSLLAVDGETVANQGDVIRRVKRTPPGRELEFLIRRGDEELRKRIQVASRARMQTNASGEDFGNGGVSLRTDGFSRVLQHDLPLAPSDMGGPLFTLEGQLVGLNIARADRVTSFALPARELLPVLSAWAEEFGFTVSALATAVPLRADPPAPSPAAATGASPR